MSSTHHAHAYLRTSPPAVKKITAKGTRLAFSSKNPGPNKSTLKGSKSKKNKPEKAEGRQNKEAEEEDEGFGAEKDDMGTSFLQYCAMCEQQIVVPNNSILYCSESCRRKDASDAPGAPYLSLFNPYSQNNLAGEDSDFSLGVKVRNIPRRRETTSPPITPRIPSCAHEGKSDLDPSEWKPNLGDHSSSEAFRYLIQFHRSPATLTPIRRPALQMRSTLASVTITTPSLSHTPATSTASEESVAGTPYEFVNRPLLPRHDPKYCTSAGIRSVDLVTPQLPLALSVPTNDVGTKGEPNMNTKGTRSRSGEVSNVSFEKKWVVERSSIAAGSLKKLLEIGNSSAAAVPLDGVGLFNGSGVPR